MYVDAFEYIFILGEFGWKCFMSTFKNHYTIHKLLFIINGHLKL